MAMDDSRLNVSRVANAGGVSFERVENRLLNDFGMSKVSAGWVPRDLSMIKCNQSVCFNVSSPKLDVAFIT